MLWGGYVEVSHFLTGEVRPYERSVAVFGTVAPKKEFDPLALVRGRERTGNLQVFQGRVQLVL